MFNGITRLAICATLVLLATGAAYGQNASPPGSDGGAVSLADVSAHATLDADPPTRQEQDAPTEKGTWDNIKHGFYAGLVIGGLVGVVMVAECGHPECGPLLTFAAGVGGAIGLGIDALVDRQDRQRDAAGVSAHGGARRLTSPAGPRVVVRLRKSW